MLITGATLVIVSLLTFYGQNVGNFIMSLDEDLKERQIYMSETEDFLVPTASLQAGAVKGARDITYSMMHIEEAVNNDGNYKDPYFKYVAYTFYVKNMGDETTSLEYETQITVNKNDLDKAIRVMIISQIDGKREDSIYMLPDTEEAVYVDMPECKYFINERLIMRERVDYFFPDQVLKFTVFLWLEGQDPDTTADVLGGQIKLQMKFTGLETED